jgi:hypothetical protein
LRVDIGVRTAVKEPSGNADIVLNDRLEKTGAPVQRIANVHIDAHAHKTIYLLDVAT